jgi:5-methylcytosine-specific restriction endonuclease McrA
LSEFPERTDQPGKHRGQCKSCIQKRRSAHYQREIDTIKAKAFDYYEKHKEKRQQQIRTYDLAHKEERLLYFVEYRIRSKGKHNQWAREYYRQHREYLLKYRKEHHRDRIRANNNKRKAKLRNAPVVDLTTAQWKEIKAAFSNRCAYCGKPVEKLTMDHLVPLSRHGAHTASNIVPACMPCNNHKKCGEPLAFHLDFTELIKTRYPHLVG